MTVSLFGQWQAVVEAARASSVAQTGYTPHWKRPYRKSAMQSLPVRSHEYETANALAHPRPAQESAAHLLEENPARSLYLTGPARIGKTYMAATQYRLLRGDFGDWNSRRPTYVMSDTQWFANQQRTEHYQKKDPVESAVLTGELLTAERWRQRICAHGVTEGRECTLCAYTPRKDQRLLPQAVYHHLLFFDLQTLASARATPTRLDRFLILLDELKNCDGRVTVCCQKDYAALEHEIAHINSDKAASVVGRLREICGEEVRLG